MAGKRLSLVEAMQSDGGKVCDMMDQAADASVEIAACLMQLADAADKMFSTGLSRKTIITLLHDTTKVNKRDIGKVLDALSTLRKDHLLS